MSIDQLFDSASRGRAAASHHDPPARRLACASARRRDAQGGAALHGGAVRARHHHAEPGAAGDHGRRTPSLIGSAFSRPGRRAPISSR